MVEWRIGGTTSVDVDADLRRRRESMSATLWNSSARYGEPQDLARCHAEFTEFFCRKLCSRRRKATTEVLLTFELVAGSKGTDDGAGCRHGACLSGETQHAVQNVTSVEPRCAGSVTHQVR